MATKTKTANVDLNSVFEGAASQFRGLSASEPGQWPMLPKALAFAGVAILMVVVGWFVVLNGAHEELDSEQAKEPNLKNDFRAKYAQAVNLPELMKQKLQVQEYVTQLEKQLPGKAEMDALLSDINQAGLGRGLQFELWKPGSVVIKDYYAELPISIKVSGRYHDIGTFAADIANLSRIVTLHNMQLTTPKEQNGSLTMETTARTYRYLDQAEIEEVRRAAAAAKAKAGGGQAATAAPAAAAGAKK